MSSKTKNRRWGLLGLLGLGGLMMMGSGGQRPGQTEDEEPTTGGSGGDGPPEDDPTTDGPGGTVPTPGTDDPADGPGGTEPTEDGPVMVEPIFPSPTPMVPTFDEPTPMIPTIPGPTPPVSGGDTPVVVEPVFPPSDDDGPPWSELVDPYPRGGIFYQVEENDRFGGTNASRSIAYRYLLSEGYLAAKEIGGLSHEEAMAWAASVGRQDKMRLAVIDLYQCSGWNDAMYGADPVQVSHASANGRSILLRPVHAPVAAALQERQTPIRNVTMKGNPADGSMRRYELLWSPAIDRTELWESGGRTISTIGQWWPDGSTMENPPPWVMALGIDDNSGALEGDFGCPGTDGELEVS
ncbi:MAG: hypothetical protein KC501_34920 [Myxococcales bacterium]|nr:hypothetical protein [Myxococcales bacterium]